jgi:DNA modification methylase
LNWSSGDENPGAFQADGTDRTARNHHPTVKPIAVMRWLIRLVTPPGGVVLDPFLGSGSTGCAAALEGARFVGIEREPDYMAIADSRIQFWAEHGDDALTVHTGQVAGERARAEQRDLGQLDIFAG